MSYLRERSGRTFPAVWLPVFLTGLLAGVFPATAGNRVIAWGAGMVTNKADGVDYGQSVAPASLTNAVLLAAGYLHGLALNANGSLQGWGDNTYGQTSFPVASNYLAIACGYLHSLALQTNGRVAAAGSDADGQTQVPGNLSNVVAVACGLYHSLALCSDGTVVAWGTSTNSAVINENDGIDYGQSVVPPGLSNVVAIAGGGCHSLALKSDGTITGWGSDAAGESNPPLGLSNVVAIAAGASHSLALRANGMVVAWGSNLYEQTNVPAGLSNVVAIACGAGHSLALKSNGTVVAWGAVVGTNANVNYGQAVVPAGLSNVGQIAAGMFNSLALAGGAPPVLAVPLTVVSSWTNSFTVSLPTRNGRVYRLEYVNSLTNRIWSAFPLQAGTGGTNFFTDFTLPGAQRFYRVTQW